MTKPRDLYSLVTENPAIYSAYQILAKVKSSTTGTSRGSPQCYPLLQLPQTADLLQVHLQTTPAILETS